MTPPNTAAVEIPAQLRSAEFRFIILPRGKKGGGNEIGWQTHANYGHDDPRLLAHVAGGGNYGVFPAAGSGVVIFDADDDAACRELGLLDIVEGKTFTTETGGSREGARKFHYFVRVDPPFEGKHPLHDASGRHLGELYTQHPESAKGYVVGPGSTHPSGNQYRVAVDLPIATVDRQQFLDAFAQYAPRAKPEPAETRERAQDGPSITARLGLRVVDFLMPHNARKRNGEWEGVHPVHGSETGSNLTCTDDQWYCRRCQSGGGPLEALAVARGIIDCADALPGCLREPAIWAKVMSELRSMGYDVGSPREKSSEETDAAKDLQLTAVCRTFNLTDAGNAERLVRRYRHLLRYCHPRRSWMIWNSQKWVEDRFNLILEFAKRTARKIYEEAGAETADERRKKLASWAAQSESVARLKAMVECATSDADVAVRPEDLDADPYLFNCRNVTIDLRTFEFYPHRKEDMLTKVAGTDYDPEADCPQWKAHLELIFDGDRELIDSTQELLGYALLPGNPLQIFPIWWGDGANGKSVTLNVVRGVFGEYATTAPPELFMALKQDGGPRPDLVAIRDARLVTAVESERGHRLNEALIKQMTGGDPITARSLYCAPETFVPTHITILATNPKPVIRGVEYAIWRRVLMWPFEVTIPPEKRIVDFERVLLEEAPGILNWMLQGLARYYERGNRIDIPEKVRAATEQYRVEQDVLAPFFREECVLEPGARVERTVLFDRYEVWCQDLGDDPMSKRAFAAALKERGIKDGGKTAGRRFWSGIRPKTQAEIRADEEAGSVQERIYAV